MSSRPRVVIDEISTWPREFDEESRRLGEDIWATIVEWQRVERDLVPRVRAAADAANRPGPHDVPRLDLEAARFGVYQQWEGQHVVDATCWCDAYMLGDIPVHVDDRVPPGFIGTLNVLHDAFGGCARWAST